MFLKKSKKAEMSFLVKILSWIAFFVIMLGALMTIFNRIGVSQ